MDDIVSLASAGENFEQASQTKNGDCKFNAANCIGCSALPSPSSLSGKKNNLKRRLDGGTDLNERPQKRRKKRGYRPKVVGIGRPRRTLEPKTPQKARPKPTNFLVNQCLNYSRKVGLNFPKKCRKQRMMMRRSKVDRWSVLASKFHESASHVTLRRTNKKSVPKNSKKEAFNMLGNKNHGRLRYQTTEIIDLTDALPSLITTKKKRSKGHICGELSWSNCNSNLHLVAKTSSQRKS
ncbi:hypothetical protein ACE6H2_010900 [Prunus campanulata]